MTEDRNRFRLRKQVLTLLHVMFVLIAVAGISAMYLNANYGKGIKWIYNEAYEDSDSFCSQLQNDISKLFTYVGYRDMFETNGKLDMHKPIVVYTDGPGARKQTYTLDQIVRYAKTRGYYLDPWRKMMTPIRSLPLITRPIIQNLSTEMVYPFV